MPEKQHADRVRINRALASAGVASRRKAEQLVLDGRITVNGSVVTDLATQVDPVNDVLAVDGRRVQQQSAAYYIYYKPRGEISTVTDELGRKCVGDLCRALAGSPRPVGRLDRRSEGLMFLTNDGDAAQRMTHPRHGTRKEYQVTIKPALQDSHARSMTQGVELDDGPARLIQLDLLDQSRDASRLMVVVDEGRNRLVRRVFEHFSYTVSLLRRTAMGPLRLGRLKPGEYRQLPAAEVVELRRQLGLKK